MASLLPPGSIIDLTEGSLDTYIKEQLNSHFVEAKKRGKTPVLPDELLYDGPGLHHWSQIIHRPAYYQVHDETRIFKKHGKDIVSYIQPSATLVDIGSGDSRKVEHLLEFLEKRRQPNIYLAVDISEESLEQNLAFLSDKHAHVRCLGLRGTFSTARKWCEDNVPHPRVFLSLGSVLFNDAWETALASLKEWANIMGDGDLLLAGMDGHTIPNDFDKIWASYHEDKELYTRFWQNGFRRANDVIGEEYFRLEDWSVRSVIEEKPVCHRFVFRAKKSVSFGKLGITFRKGEDMEWFDAHKYPEDKVRLACSLAGLSVLKVWKLGDSEMTPIPSKTNLAGFPMDF